MEGRNLVNLQWLMGENYKDQVKMFFVNEKNITKYFGVFSIKLHQVK